MTLPSKLLSCLTAALLVVPTAANAKTLRLPHDFVMPAPKSSAKSAKRDLAGPQQVGSANEATADPLVPRPNETPCVDTIFSNATFGDYAPHTFSYTPPAGCPGPYNRIVFNGNFSVSAGIQFDRTASIEFGNVPLYFGTTAEPDPSLSPSWHVERDITDDAALLATPQSVEADIFNIVNSTYTGVISGTAFIQFYPARGKFTPTPSPDLVLPFPGVAGGPQQLPTAASTLTATYTLPTNVTSAFMDVYSQSQQEDEQYFLCAPNDVAAELFACPSGSLRQTEVAIDGVPAGAAPVYPWIFTGGLDPYLWSPIPGVQTLEFKPYRVNLTPFAAILSNGKPHTITLSVDNADAYFQGFATLFAYQDHHRKTVTGGLIEDTLVANPPATVTESIDPTTLDGSIVTTSTRKFETEGYVNTSYGRITTKVKSELVFANQQAYSNQSALTETLAVKQTTIGATQVDTQSRGKKQIDDLVDSFPLSVTLALVLDDTGTGTQVATIDQKFVELTDDFGSTRNYKKIDSNEVSPTDTLDILDDAYITGNANQSSKQIYEDEDSYGYCFTLAVEAAANVVTKVQNGGVGCGGLKAELTALAPYVFH